MKKLLGFSLLFFAVVFTSCDEEKDKCDENGNCMWFTIDGEEFVSEGTNGAVLDIFGISSYNIGGAQGTGISVKTTQIVLTNPVVGDNPFLLTQAGQDVIITYADSNGDVYSSTNQEGTLNATTLNSDELVIEATFEGKLVLANGDPDTDFINISSGYVKVNQ